MAEIIKTLSEILGLIGVAILAVYLFVKFYVESKVKDTFQKGLETHKDQLRREADKELESIKAKFQDELKHKEIRFTKLREQQAPIFKDFYLNLSTVFDEIGNLVLKKPSPIIPNDNFNNFYALFESYKDYYDKHRIFFNGSLCEKIDRLNLATLAIFASVKESYQQIHDKEKSDEAWKRAWRFYQEDGSNAKKDIENELRSVMGV